MEPVEIDIRMRQNIDAESKKGKEGVDAIAQAIEKARGDIDRHTLAVVELRKDLVGLGTAYKKATTKEAKSEILTEIELTKKNIIDETQAIKVLKSEIASMNKMPKSVAMPDANQVAKTAMGYNSLNMSVQQVVRELPAASMGLNMFFLAISNNIPILADNIKRARLENEALKASGSSSTPVWKQLVGSLFSWQSAMMIGISLITVYGKDIANWVTELITGEKAVKKMTESQLGLAKANKIMIESLNSGSEFATAVSTIEKLSISLEKAKGNRELEKKAVDDYNTSLGKTFGKVNDIDSALKKINQNKDAYIQAMKDMSFANAFFSKSAEDAIKILEVKLKSNAEVLGADADLYRKNVEEKADRLRRAQAGEVVTGKKIVRGGLGESLIKDVQMTVPELQKELNQATSAYNAAAGKARDKQTAEISKHQSESLKQATGYYSSYTNIFKDNQWTTDVKDSTVKTFSEMYNSESDFQKLIYALTEKSESMLIGIKEDSLAKRLELIQQEKDKEVNSIREKELAIIGEYNKSQKKKADEYNKTHKDKMQPELLSTAPGDISSSLVTINPKQAEQLAKATEAVNNAFQQKVLTTTKDWNTEQQKLALEFASKTEQIRASYMEKIKKLEANGQKDIAGIAATEMEKKISEEEQKLMEETDIYKIAIDEKLKLTKEMNDKLLKLVKDRINANENLSEEDKKKLIDKVDQSDAGRASNPLSGLIKSYGNLKKAKEDAASAEKLGDVEGAAKASKKIEKSKESILGYGQAILGYFNQASSGIVGIMDQMGMFTEEEKQQATDVVNTVSSAGTLAMGIATGDISSIISGAIGTISGLLKIFDKKGRDIERKQKSIQKNIDELTAAYARLQRQAEKALGTDVYDAQKSQIENLKQQIVANEEWIAQENRKKRKKRNKKEIEERKKEIEDLKNSIDDVIQSIADDLAQTTAKDLTSQVSDAIVQGIADGSITGSNMMGDVLGGVLNSVLKDAVTNALEKQFLEKQMGEAVSYLSSSMADGKLSDEERARFAEMVTQAGNNYNEALTAYKDILAGSESARTGAQKGIATASQDTMDEVKGGVYALRMGVSDIRNNTREQTLVIKTITTQLDTLIDNTEPITEMAVDIKNLTKDINEIKTRGINVKV